MTPNCDNKTLAQEKKYYYLNQGEVDMVAAEIFMVSPKLKISTVSSCNGKATGVNIEITEKNNKNIIDKLIAIGFKQECRYFSSAETGFASVLTLKKSL